MKTYKKDFPIFQKNKSLVYLDSAATSQKPKDVIDSIKDFYENYNANVRRGLYPIAERASQKVEQVRKKVARFINAKDVSEIIFVRNTTEAINLAAYSVLQNIRRGDIVFSTITEHHSNFVPWQQICRMKKANFEVIDINNNFQFSISPFDLAQDKNFKSPQNLKRGKILAITHASNVLGIVNPISEIIKEVKKINPDIKILVDAAQSIPHMKVDVQALDCEFLAFSGHKMMAGTGIGVLYVKKEVLAKLEPFLFGGEMVREVTLEKTTFDNLPFRFEAGTPDISGIISLGVAIDYLEEVGMDNVFSHEKKLTEYCFDEMKKIKGIKLLNDQYTCIQGIEKSGIISFNIEGVHPHDVAQVLGDINICIRAGHHCAMPLHKRLGLESSARASFYIYNDEEDVDKFIGGLKKVKKIFNV